MTTPASQKPTPAVRALPPRNLPAARRTVLIAVVLAVAIVAAGYPSLGVIAIAICALFGISFVPWRLTSYGRPIDADPLVVPYLVTVILFKLQVGEEYLTAAWDAFGRIGQPLSERTLVVVAGTIVPIFWLLGLILLVLRTEIGNWMTWVFVVAMAIVEPSHLFFPFLETGRFGYFPGLYACLPLMTAGWYLGWLMWCTATGRPSPTLRQGYLWLLGNTLNPVAIRAARAGRGPFSLVRHIGRKTGREYETPIIVAPVDGGFIAELTYGTTVSWYRNVVAANGCTVVVKGVEHVIDGVEEYPTDAGRRAFGFPAGMFLKLLGRKEFRLLREAPRTAEATQ
jgi:deazaflavin-dependent oxidoreductase (nitroreductase family)